MESQPHVASMANHTYHALICMEMFTFIILGASETTASSETPQETEGRRIGTEGEEECEMNEVTTIEHLSCRLKLYIKYNVGTCNVIMKVSLFHACSAHHVQAIQRHS